MRLAPPFGSAPPTPDPDLWNHKTQLEKGPSPPHPAHHRLTPSKYSLAVDRCLVVPGFVLYPLPASLLSMTVTDLLVGSPQSWPNAHLLLHQVAGDLLGSTLPWSPPHPTHTLFSCLSPFLRLIPLQLSSTKLVLRVSSLS